MPSPAITLKSPLLASDQGLSNDAAVGGCSLFEQAHPDARVGYVVWIDDDLELAADNLRNMAIAQSGGIGHERLSGWMGKHGLTQERAAQALGVSRRKLNYYLSGAKPIPKTVWLACLGWETTCVIHRRIKPLTNASHA